MSAHEDPRLTRREFVGTAGALATAASFSASAGASAFSGEPTMPHPLSPAINPAYLTGAGSGWPLQELAGAGYRSLEVTPACLENRQEWGAAAEKTGLPVLCIHAMEELRPYLTGSLTDAVEWRRRATLDRLKATLSRMQDLGVERLVVAPSRLAENYQSVEQARALLIESLRELAEASAAAILLEAAPFRLFSTAAEIAAIVDATQRPNVAAALDVGHALLIGEDPAQAARTLGARLRYVQIHDADVRPGVPRLDRHLPPGGGALNRDAVRHLVGDLPYCINIAEPDAPVKAARGALHWWDQ